MALPRRYLLPAAASALAAAAAAHALSNYGTWRRALDEVRSQASSHSDYWRQRARQGSFQVIVLGDSAAQAVGVADPEDGWVGLVERRLSAHFGQQVATWNLSVSGATTKALVDEQIPLLQDLTDTPDLVICEIGSNDIAARRFSLQQFEDSLRQIATQLPPGSVLAEIPSFGLALFNVRVRAANTIVHAVAAEHGHVVAPLYEATLHPQLLNHIRHLSSDVFHPNAVGYTRWGEGIWPGVIQALDRRSNGGRPSAPNDRS